MPLEDGPKSMALSKIGLSYSFPHPSWGLSEGFTMALRRFITGAVNVYARVKEWVCASVRCPQCVVVRTRHECVYSVYMSCEGRV